MAGCTTGKCSPGDLAKPVKDGIASQNPVLIQALGICSALAVTSFVSTTLVMGAALLFVSAFSTLAISLLRKAVPHRVRLIVQMLVISTLVILVHLYLRAYWFDMSKALGPYVGLIITNCLILGRCEGYAMRNGPLLSFLDGLGNAAGYALVLLAIALIREPLGHGTLLGMSVVPSTFKPAMLVASAPGAFLCMGLVVWVVRSIWPEEEPTEHPEAQQ
ncbi:MAG: NADH:ubiquinone reductase (Na(+)-transporting) subunit D [Lentisphaerae bacterium]|jgi:Na+-transporting NADH:ubiquinone oxidoreductase subunit D|nr:NADH:ubiquinone reductase (Na(+)-transporting) subunit D [Lentisphaerota bacterium]MBT5607812.1 NADH:ubiquinone reductase (Na(+)-transporting) subunit D [Lentisphaerota bacterium]MBT7058718.1 NADH:ubiquinone reductase (Na(+)-transporting) subunit D [Lentisphaerota bacterium]MBT7847078.1 NADH:ubiquinone reductase (Na(+)-transporting) subunit D [Lentisphaerota bacterium]